MTDDYSDIINMPHHVSENHPQMDISMRAAQFSPFSALNGFEEKIKNTSEVNTGIYNVRIYNKQNVR